MDDEKEIKADVTISVRSDDLIMIRVKDRISGYSFLELEMTREQVMKAAMNQLANTPVNKATVRGLNRVGRQMRQELLEFVLPDDAPFHNVETAIRVAKEVCRGSGWEPELYFQSQDSFFDRDGKAWARTSMRRWA